MNLSLKADIQARAMVQPSRRDIARHVQRHRASAIARIQLLISDVPSDLPHNVTVIFQLLLSPREVEITMKAAEDLITFLAIGKLTSTEITNVSLRRAELAQMLASVFLVGLDICY